MKIIFMGTPDFARDSLEALVNAKHEILAVVTNPDKPQGRGMKMVASPVKQYAVETKLKVLQPEKIRNNVEFLNQIKIMNPDLICVVAYGKILPQEILEIPKYGCINVHGSLLPKYRGAAPIQWAIINGDSITGVTTMFMDAGMDTGDIILKQEVAIGENETTGELWERLSKEGAKLLVETINQIKNGTVKRIKQSDNYSLAPMLNKEMANIDWENKTGNEIKNLVRGLNPIMGAFTYLKNKKYKFWKVDVISNNDFINAFEGFNEYLNKLNNVVPGTILYVSEKRGLYVKAKDSIISILEIQGENGKRMPIGDFLRGNKIEVAEMFGRRGIAFSI